MNLVIPRRAFLLSAVAAATELPTAAWAIEPFPRPRPSHFKLSIAAYSFRDYLTGDSPRMDLFQFVDLAADLRLDGVELTSYYFPPDTDNDYLHRLQRHAFLQGLDVSGTAVMNDFCVPDGAAWDENRKHVQTWIDRAAELHAPIVRVLSGNWIQGTPEEVLEQRVIARLRDMLPYAQQRGVMLALENHGGGVTVTAKQLLRIVRAVQGLNFGVNLDTGNFHSDDPYAEIAAVAPYAINVQVKPDIRRKGKSKEDADLAKLVQILREAKYSGYVVIEYNASEDPMTAVPRMAKQLRELIS